MRFRKNLVSKLNKYVPGVPVIDVDDDEAMKYLHEEDPWMVAKKAYNVRLAIPLMEQFKDYDRVVWVDCDVDIVSNGFSDILKCETGEDGFAMAMDAISNYMIEKYLNSMRELYGPYDKAVYFYSGIAVMDLKKINKEKLKHAIYDLKEKKYRFPDQDALNFNFDIKPIDQKFNFSYRFRARYPKGTNPCAIHYHGISHRVLYDILQTEDNGGTPPVDAVFVIGKVSNRENEKLRYALRSLDANCKFVRNVYICGECPEWVDKSSVIHLPWPDRFRHSNAANIIDKMKHACERNEIAKRILFCHGRQFQTVECSWDDFSPKYLRKYKTGDKWIDGVNSSWYKNLKETLEREVLRRKKKGLNLDNVYFYEPNIWVQIDRDRFLDYAKWSEYDKSKYAMVTSGYLNYIDSKPESKLGKHHFLTGSERYLPDVVHIAYSDGKSYDAAMGFMKEMFSVKSRFEVDREDLETCGELDRESMAGLFRMRLGL